MVYLDPTKKVECVVCGKKIAIGGMAIHRRSKTHKLFLYCKDRLNKSLDIIEIKTNSKIYGAEAKKAAKKKFEQSRRDETDK